MIQMNFSLTFLLLSAVCNFSIEFDCISDGKASGPRMSFAYFEPFFFFARFLRENSIKIFSSNQNALECACDCVDTRHFQKKRQIYLIYARAIIKYLKNAPTNCAFSMNEIIFLMSNVRLIPYINFLLFFSIAAITIPTKGEHKNLYIE